MLDSIEPVGGTRGDVQAAIVASTMANCHLGKGKSVKPSDFMPEWWRAPITPQDKGRQIAEQLRAWGQAYNESLKAKGP